MASHDPEAQINSLDNKLSTTLHKIGEVYKLLLLKTGKTHGLSAIQVQILIYVAYHKEGTLRTVSHLAEELNITKPTVSDAVKTLFQKQLINKSTNEDTRSYSITLTPLGQATVSQLEDFDEEILTALAKLDLAAKSSLLETSLSLLSKLEKDNVIGQQRMCLSCKHLIQKSGDRYCNLLRQPLSTSDLRIDCEEFSKVGA